MMSMRMFAAGIGSIAVLATGSAAAAACQMGLLAEAPLQEDHGHLYVTIEVNGHEVHAALVTESPESGVAGWALAKLGLSQHPSDAKTSTPAGVDIAYFSTVDTIKLGALTFRNTPMWVEGHTNAKPVTAEVTLGARFMAQSDIEFDLQHHMLRLFKPVGCKDDEVLYWGGAFSVAPLLANPDGENELMTEVKLNGTLVEAHLATGWSYTMVSSATANRVGARPAPDGPAPFDTRYLMLRPERFDSFVLDQEAAKNVTLAVATMKQIYAQDTISHLETHQTIPPMYLGEDFIAAHRLLFANSQHKLYFTYTGGQIFKAAVPGDTGVPAFKTSLEN